MDLKAEFARTGLPRGALANYLGIDNGAVSRALGGGPALDANQEREAAAFFSVVSPDADGNFVSAVRKLRAPTVRKRAIALLSDWLRRNGVRPKGESHPIDRLIHGATDLRADQIVAIARSEQLDLPSLVSGREARPAAPGLASPPSDRREADMRLETAARSWAFRTDAVYSIAKGVPATSSRIAAQPSDAQAAAVELYPLDEPPFEASVWKAFAVTDDRLLPRFHPGDSLLCAYPEEPSANFPTRSMVAVFLQPDYRRAVIGHLLAVAAGSIVVQPPSGLRVEIPRAQVAKFARLVGCAF